MMPYLSFQNILAYNKKLFLECGLDDYISDQLEIQNWTIEEWEDILDTLAANLPSDCYPTTMYGSNNQGDTHIMTLLRSRGADIFKEDGTFDFTQPKIVEALAWLQDGVDRGWYMPHPENLEIIDNQRLFTDGRLGIYIFNNASFVIEDEDLGNYGFANFPGNLCTSFITGFEVFDNGNPAKVQAAKDLLSFIYNDEELMDLSAGTIPESKRVAEKYASQITLLPLFTGNTDHVIDFMHGANNWQGRDDSIRSVFWKEIHDLIGKLQTPQKTAENLTLHCNEALQVDTAYMHKE